MRGAKLIKQSAAKLIKQRHATRYSWINYLRETVESVCPFETSVSDEWVDLASNRFSAKLVGQEQD